jgi:hypothetical protein
MDFLIFLREHSLLGKARGPVTRREAQLMILFFLEFIRSQGFPYHINLQISKDTLPLSQISYPTNPNASVHAKNQSNMWSLSKPTCESNIGISNDMQQVKHTNDMQSTIMMLGHAQSTT